MNLTVVFLIGHIEGYLSRRTWAMICDGLVRPAVTGVGVFIVFHRTDRLLETSQLHVKTRVILYCLAAPHLDIFSMTFCQRFISSKYTLNVYMFEAICNLLQMQLTNLKLHMLGFQRLARTCNTLTRICAAGWIFWFVGACGYLITPHLVCGFVLYVSLLLVTVCLTLLLLLQFLGLCVAAGKALSVGWHDADIRNVAGLLYLNSILQLLGPVMSVRGAKGFLQFHDSMDADDLIFLTLDVCLQVLNGLLLSGLVGPQQWQDPMAALQQLANYQGFSGLTSKRIAFAGRVNENSRDCIVSFPGKYSEEWDQAVSVAKTQEAFSLACVFLTDRASGLGVHCDNPHAVGECWCRAIYGHLPASTYISVVDMRPEMQASQAPIDLEFKRADAQAMGQRLATLFDFVHV